ncbi:MAG: zinc ribbon domain-containing protein [Myxococcota bacterium]
MPTYDYTCDSCGHEFEREQRITEDPIKRCPRCGKMKARRMIGGGGFILKGGGWESDLYSGPSNRSKSDTGSTKSDGGGSSGSDGSSTSTKTDSKPSTSSKSDS